MKHKMIRLVLMLAVASLAVIALRWLWESPPAQAQGGTIWVDKRLGRASPVVYVGEYITFTVFIRNDTTFTITTLPLSDTYNINVLRFVDAVPPPDSINPASGRLDWNDLTAHFGPLGPGQSVLVVVGFVAEHPAPSVVNAAEVHDALGDAGALGGGNSILTDTVSIGGSSPVDKSLAAGLIPQAGLPVTYTIVITNNGFVTMTVMPLVDDYNPAWVEFHYAVPPPDFVDLVRGVITWTDITSWTGDIPAHGVVSVTTVFTALVSGSNITNTARTEGGKDWFDNDLGGGADLVPIVIVERPTSTPAPTRTPAPTETAMPTATSQPSTPQPTPTAGNVEQPTATTTATAAAIAIPAPLTLPETGQGSYGWLLWACIALMSGGVLLVYVWRAMNQKE